VESPAFAGTDAERRAALACAAKLRAAGRSPRVQTLWFRPQRDVPRIVHALLGIAGSVVAVKHHPVGLGLAAGGLVLSLLEAGGVPVVALPFARRATQNVVAPPLDDAPGAIRLVLTASADDPRDSFLGRIARRTRGAPLPGPAGLLDVALAAVAGCAGARLAGAGGTALGVVQLVPTIVLILLFAGYVEAAIASRPARRGGAEVAAVAVATAAALDVRPPRRMVVEVLIAGAGESGAAGMRAYVRANRRRIAPEQVVVVHLVPGPAPLRFHVREGERFALRLHPRLAELAAELPGAQASEGRELTAARVARGARWPALTLCGPPSDLGVAALRLVASIDKDLINGGAGRRR
jgi:hypothetical protein